MNRDEIFSSILFSSSFSSFSPVTSSRRLMQIEMAPQSGLNISNLHKFTGSLLEMSSLIHNYHRLLLLRGSVLSVSGIEYILSTIHSLLLLLLVNPPSSVSCSSSQTYSLTICFGNNNCPALPSLPFSPVRFPSAIPLRQPQRFH